MPLRMYDPEGDREKSSVKDKKKKVSMKESINMRKDARRDFVRSNRMLTGGQAKLDKNKNNRIDAQDFKILRAEKAKGRGQGLQDEKMKPGKPMKAALGVIALGRGAKKMKEKGKMMPFGFGAAGAIAKKKKEILGKKVGGELKKDPTKPINPADRGMKKRMAERAMRAAKATKVGKIAAGVAGVGLAAKAYLNKKLEESRAKKKVDKKKMGGLKAELNNPAKGYMTGGMAEYYKDLM